MYVCQGRAVADGLIVPGTFADPFAARVLLADELADVELGRQAEPPQQPTQQPRERMRWERMRAVAEVIVPRTVAIDAAVRDAAHPQVVIVGAGLDCRPWRMPELGRIFSVDHPDTQADTRRRVAALPAPDGLAWIPVDLGNERLGPALAAAGHDVRIPTMWIWEGVIPYLTRTQVEGTLGELATASAAGSTLVVNYQTPWAIARAGRLLAGVVSRVAGQESPMAAEPWRSLWKPARMAEALKRHGFSVERDEDLLAVAARIGSPTGRARSLKNGRVAVAARR